MVSKLAVQMGFVVVIFTGWAIVVDPKKLTSSKKAYMFKQPFYEPFMGGGFVTALSIPLIKFWGIWSYFLITVMALMLVFLFGFALRRKQQNS